jgi:hypothetical protein
MPVYSNKYASLVPLELGGVLRLVRDAEAKEPRQVAVVLSQRSKNICIMGSGNTIATSEPISMANVFDPPHG